MQMQDLFALLLLLSNPGFPRQTKLLSQYVKELLANLKICKFDNLKIFQPS